MPTIQKRKLSSTSWQLPTRSLDLYGEVLQEMGEYLTSSGKLQQTREHF
jgi:hypothetical protein